ncbi:unnamed protein product, partial [Pocillopora meandrina]
NDLQNSGKDDDDFGSVDLVEEIPTEVRTSNSVSPGRDLPSESIEDSATTEGTNGPSSEIQLANEGSADNDGSEGEDIAEQDMWTRPQRQRRPPQILTYNPWEIHSTSRLSQYSAVHALTPFKLQLSQLFIREYPCISGCGHAVSNLSTTRGLERSLL